MNILVICQHYYPEPYRLSDICENLVIRGHEVTVLTGLPNYPEGRIYEDYRHGEKRQEYLNGVNVIRSFLIPRGNNHLMLFLNYISFATCGAFKVLMMDGHFDVIFVHQTSPVLMAIPAIAYKKKHGKKILLYCGDPWPDSLAAGGIKNGSLIYRLFWYISRWIYGKADKLMVTSYMFKDYFKVTFGMDSNIIEYLPPYAEDFFANISTLADSEQTNLVFAGNIGKAQSVETIILAANELKEHQDIVFHLVGSGSNLEECRKLANELNLSNIVFYGRRPIEDMQYFYGMADAMLVTLKESKSFSSTLPSKVQTYMAAGKPIIGAANGETKRVIEEAKCGFCCNAEDFKGLADSIEVFCKSANKHEMGLNSRAFNERIFSKEQFINALEKSLLDLGAIDSV